MDFYTNISKCVNRVNSNLTQIEWIKEIVNQMDPGSGESKIIGDTQP